MLDLGLLGGWAAGGPAADAGTITQTPAGVAAAAEADGPALAGAFRDLVDAFAGGDARPAAAQTPAIVGTPAVSATPIVVPGASLSPATPATQVPAGAPVSGDTDIPSDLFVNADDDQPDAVVTASPAINPTVSLATTEAPAHSDAHAAGRHERVPGGRLPPQASKSDKPSNEGVVIVAPVVAPIEAAPMPMGVSTSWSLVPNDADDADAAATLDVSSGPTNPNTKTNPNTNPTTDTKAAALNAITKAARHDVADPPMAMAAAVAADAANRAVGAPAVESPHAAPQSAWQAAVKRAVANASPASPISDRAAAHAAHADHADHADPHRDAGAGSESGQDLTHGRAIITRPIVFSRNAEPVARFASIQALAPMAARTAPVVPAPSVAPAMPQKPAAVPAPLTSSHAKTVAVTTPVAYPAFPSVTGMSGLLSRALEFESTTPSLSAESTAPQIVSAIRLAWTRGGGEAQIRLDPRQFGDLTVSLRVEDGQVVARLQADSPAVREWLQTNQRTLQDGLAAHDLKLNRFEVAAPPDEARDAARRDARDRRDQAQDRPARRQKPPNEGQSFDIVA